MSLPTRAATLDDAPAIRDLIAACERPLFGRSEVTLDWVRAHLTRTGLILATDTLVVPGDDGSLVAWATSRGGRRATVHVHPDRHGQGLGTRLLAFTERRAREIGGTRLAQMLWDADRRAVGLLEAAGYAPSVTEWLLEIGLDTEPDVAALPDGLAMRAFERGDERRVHRMIEGAFADWQSRRHGFDEWARMTVRLDTFAPGLSPLVFDGDRLVGALLALDRPDSSEGYVEQLAVARDYRNRGLARLLLRHAFAGFYRQGRRSCTLHTHSDTGALALYERVGMSVRRSSTLYSIMLTPAGAAVL